MKTPQTAPHGVNHPATEEKIPFALALAAIKKERLFSIHEMAGIVQTTPRTFEKWIYCGARPTAERQRQVIAALSCPHLPPSTRMRWNMEARHGLTWDKARRRWKLRITIDRGPKLVGKRYCVTIKSPDPAVAIAAKFSLLDMLRQIGVNVKQRLQQRRDLSNA